jgi:hypothetical protein
LGHSTEQCRREHTDHNRRTLRQLYHFADLTLPQDSPVMEIETFSKGATGEIAACCKLKHSASAQAEEQNVQRPMLTTQVEAR